MTTGPGAVGAAGRPDGERLTRLLGDPGLGWLVDRVVQRVERGRPLTGTVTKAAATRDERAALGRLLGRSPGHGTSLSVSLDDVAAMLRRAGVVDDLRAAVQGLRGPVHERAAAATAREAAWSALLDEAAAWAAGRQPFERWVHGLSTDGLLRRLAGGDPRRGHELLSAACGVLDRLPVGGVPRSVLAADALGDGHGLDDGRPVATLVLRGGAALAGLPHGEGSRWRREVWAGVGVLVADLARPVVALGLPGDPTPVGRALGALAEAGQPAALTLRQLLRDPPSPPVAGCVVFACENPAVVSAAADRLGSRCSPLVCVDGHPAAAATTLLRRLAEAGAILRYHGDFDWAGITIANGVRARAGAQPWRMGSDDYRAAADRSRRSLHGLPVDADWEPALLPEMTARGVRVEEELVIDDLLSDLGA